MNEVKLTKLSDFVMKWLHGFGVNQIFAVAGGGCMHLLDSLGRSEIEAVHPLHEQSASIMADGVAQLNNDIGVCLVTTGPGSTNAITGVTASYIDGQSVLVISGQVKTADMIKDSGLRQRGMQEVDIISMVKPITKYAITVTDPNEIMYILQKATYLALTGRKAPVWIDIPLDIQNAMINENALNTFQPAWYLTEDFKHQGKEIIELISKAKRPVFLLGNGVRGLERFLYPIINELKIPFLLTWKAMDLFADNHVLNAGRSGVLGQRNANLVQQTADLIISLGARLDLGQVAFDYNNFGKNAKKIVVDIDCFELEKLPSNFYTKVNADVYYFLNFLNENVDKIKFTETRQKWMVRCNELKKKYSVMKETIKHQSPLVQGINTYSLIDALSEQMTKDDILVPDSSGTASEITQQAFRVKHGQRLICSPGLGSMGFGLPQAIGVAIASGKRVVCIIGDGSLQHNIQELELLHRYPDLNLKVFVLNNHGYASIRATQDKFFESNYVGSDDSTGFTLPDTFTISEAYKIQSGIMNNNFRIEEDVATILDSTGTFLCEVFVQPNLTASPRVMSKMVDGKMQSGKMEDMHPYLPEDELAEIMDVTNKS